MAVKYKSFRIIGKEIFFEILTRVILIFHMCSSVFQHCLLFVCAVFESFINVDFLVENMNDVVPIWRIPNPK